MNDIKGQGYAFSASNACTGKEESELDRLMGEFDSYQEKMQKVGEKIQEIHNNNKLVELRKQSKELLGSPIYVKRDNMYGIITYILLDVYGNLQQIQARCFQTDTINDECEMNREIYSLTHNIHLSKDEFELISDDVYLHEMNKFQDKLLKYMKNRMAPHDISYGEKHKCAKDNGFDYYSVYGLLDEICCNNSGFQF